MEMNVFDGIYNNFTLNTVRLSLVGSVLASTRAPSVVIRLLLKYYITIIILVHSSNDYTLATIYNYVHYHTVTCAR